VFDAKLNVNHLNGDAPMTNVDLEAMLRRSAPQPSANSLSDEHLKLLTTAASMSFMPGDSSQNGAAAAPHTNTASTGANADARADVASLLGDIDADDGGNALQSDQVIDWSSDLQSVLSKLDILDSKQNDQGDHK